MKKNNVFWGVLLVIAAICIIVSRLGFMPNINVIHLVIAVFCVVTFVKSLMKMKFAEMLFSLAVLAIIFDDYLGITALTPWPVLMAALLGSIGLNMIFGNREKERRKQKEAELGFKGSEFVSGEEIVINGMFNGYKKTISSDNFMRAKIKCRFCGMELSFDDAVIQGGTAYVDLDVSFSGVEIYIPQSWKIEDQTDSVFGGFEEHRPPSVETGPTLVFTGNIRFGGVEVYRI